MGFFFSQPPRENNMAVATYIITRGFVNPKPGRAANDDRTGNETIRFPNRGNRNRVIPPVNVITVNEKRARAFSKMTASFQTVRSRNPKLLSRAGQSLATSDRNRRAGTFQSTATAADSSTIIWLDDDLFSARRRYRHHGRPFRFSDVTRKSRVALTNKKRILSERKRQNVAREFRGDVNVITTIFRFEKNPFFGEQRSKIVRTNS